MPTIRTRPAVPGGVEDDVARRKPLPRSRRGVLTGALLGRAGPPAGGGGLPLTPAFANVSTIERGAELPGINRAGLTSIVGSFRDPGSGESSTDVTDRSVPGTGTVPAAASAAAFTLSCVNVLGRAFSFGGRRWGGLGLGGPSAGGGAGLGGGISDSGCGSRSLPAPPPPCILEDSASAFSSGYLPTPICCVCVFAGGHKCFPITCRTTSSSRSSFISVLPGAGRGVVCGTCCAMRGREGIFGLGCFPRALFGA